MEEVEQASARVLPRPKISLSHLFTPYITNGRVRYMSATGPVLGSTFDDGQPSLSEAYCTEEDALTLLGRGKFSVVHRTQRRSDGLPVALKTIQVAVPGMIALPTRPGTDPVRLLTLCAASAERTRSPGRAGL